MIMNNSITVSTLKDQFTIEITKIITINVTMTMMTLIKMNIQTITVRNQFTIKISNIITTKIITTMITLMIES
jgi:hypothetical protein